MSNEPSEPDPGPGTPWRVVDVGRISIPARVLETASQLPDEDAVVDGDVRLTYADLARRVTRAVSALMASGVEPGDRVALWAPNSHRWVVAALGVMGAGGSLVPLNTRFKGAEAGALLRASGARMLLTERGFLGIDYVSMLADWLAEGTEDLPDLESTVVLDGAIDGDTTWDELVAAGDAVADAAALERVRSVGPDDISDVLFTSGTTGRPKGAMSAHGQVLRHVDSWSDVVGMRVGDRQLVVTPFFHTTGYKCGWLATLLRGGAVVPMATFDPPSVLALVARERITFLQGPPTLLQDLLDAVQRERCDVSTLRTTVTGAATIPVELIVRLRDVGVFDDIFTGYGLTECNGPASLSRLGDDFETIARFSGRAMPDTEVKIAALSGGGDAPTGEPGEILLRGYHVMRGYLGDPAATQAAVDPDGWLRTGDVGTLDDRGYVTITGRLKEMFIVGGFNVYPSEVETALAEYGGVSDVAVIGVPDARLGEVGMAFVVPEPGTVVEADDFITWARTRVANYKVPRHVRLLERVPRNAMGKVVRDELRAIGAGEATPGEVQTTPTTGRGE